MAGSCEYVKFFYSQKSFSFLSNAPHIIKLKFQEIKNTVRVPSRMKLAKNPVFLHYFSKFMEILFVLKYMYISFLLKMINGFSWPAKIMASPFKYHHLLLFLYLSQGIWMEELVPYGPLCNAMGVHILWRPFWGLSTEIEFLYLQIWHGYLAHSLQIIIAVCLLCGNLNTWVIKVHVRKATHDAEQNAWRD